MTGNNPGPVVANAIRGLPRAGVGHSRAFWHPSMLRPVMLLVLAYAIAICFERVVQIEIFKPYRVIGGALILVALARGRLLVDGIARTAMLYAAIGLFLGAATVIATSGNLQTLMADNVLWVFNISTYIAICSLLRNRREVAIALLVHSVAMVFASYDILTHSAEMLVAEGASVRVAGDFKNPAHACLSMLAATLVLITALRGIGSSRAGMSRKLLVFAIGTGIVAFELYAASLTGSRAGAVQFLGGVMVYLLVIGRKRVALAVIALGLAAVVMLTQADAWPDQPSSNILLQRSESKGIDTDRFYLWRSGLDAYVDSFGLGVGNGQYRFVHQIYYQPYVQFGDPRLINYQLSLHSDYVAALVEFGTFGFVVFLVLFRRIWKSANAIVDTNVRALSLALLLAAAVNAMAHAVLPYFGLWFYLAMIATWLRLEKTETSSGVRPA